MGIAPNNVTHSVRQRCTASGLSFFNCKRRSAVSSIVRNWSRAYSFGRYCDDCHYAGTCWLTMIFFLLISDKM